MTPAEHRAEAERLLDEACNWHEHSDDERASFRELAQVHATLALAPQQPAQPPQQRRWNLDGEYQFIDDQASELMVWPERDLDGVFVGALDGQHVWLFTDPSTLRNLASVLTAHADRLESKP